MSGERGKRDREFGEAVARIVGGDFLRVAGRGDWVDGVQAGWVVEPGSVQEVSGVLKVANEVGARVVVRGGGTKMGWGNVPTGVEIILGMGRLNKVVEHAAGDMTATVEAGCCVADFQKVLAEKGQRLAVDVLWGERGGGATVGGILATNDSGMLRGTFGALRDQLIGVTVVLADGTVAKSGGKVVKNVAGYDLPKLMIGSFGTLGVMVEAVFRLYPVAKASRRLAFEVAAGEGLREMVKRLPECVGVATAVQMDMKSGGAVDVQVLVEGLTEAIEGKVERVRRLVFNDAVVSEGAIDPAQMPEALFEGAVARISVLPTQWPDLYDALMVKLPKGAQFRMIAQAMGIGLLAMRDGDVVGRMREARRIVEGIGGSMTVLSGSAELKKEVGVWPEVGEALGLMKRVKGEFDGKRILSPGRFVGGI